MLASPKIKALDQFPGPDFVLNSGAPGGTRTHNPWVRSPVLYPLSYRRMAVMRWGLGRATGFEPVVSCATDRRLGPLGYARHIGAEPPGFPRNYTRNSSRSSRPPPEVPALLQPGNVSKKAGGLQEGTDPRPGRALNLPPVIQYNGLDYFAYLDYKITAYKITMALTLWRQVPP